jgi:hypothetical protein
LVRIPRGCGKAVEEDDPLVGIGQEIAEGREILALLESSSP